MPGSEHDAVVEVVVHTMSGEVAKLDSDASDNGVRPPPPPLPPGGVQNHQYSSDSVPCVSFVSDVAGASGVTCATTHAPVSFV